MTTTSLSSIKLVETPVEQLDLLAANPDNCFTKTAERIKYYIQTGKSLNKAVAALYTFYDMRLMCALSKKAPEDLRESVKKEIQSLIASFRHSEDGKGINQYEVTEVSIRDEINALGARIKTQLRDIFDGVDKFLFFQDAQ